MDVAALGEFGLIRRIEALARRVHGRSVVLGIGDDAAVVRPRAGHDVVVSADAFVEGVHFRFDHESPRIAGRRAMAAALSDLAAMGASPLGVTLSLSVPRRAEVARVLGLVRGLLDLGEIHRAPLIGGNVARSRSLELHLTVLGEAPRGRCLRRDGARAGDRLYVSGALGRSALERARGRVRHVPTPRLELGGRLLRHGRVQAAIDVSDGLLADLEHLCAASGVGAELEVPALPRPRGFEGACRRAGRDPEALLLTGGEDYELLFAVRGGPIPSAEVAGVPIAPIGRLVPRGRRLHGLSAALPARSGWRHF